MLFTGNSNSNSLFMHVIDPIPGDRVLEQKCQTTCHALTFNNTLV